MTVTEQPSAHEIGAVFASRAREEPIAREHWVTDERDGVHLWLLIDPIKHDDAERELYGLVVVLDTRVPGADFQLHVLNPLDFTGDPRESLPGHAEQIALHAT